MLDRVVLKKDRLGNPFNENRCKNYCVNAK